MNRTVSTSKVLPVAPEADVAAFIAAHGSPYDGDRDSYQRDPLVAHGKHGKGSAIYNAHAYHTKVPPEAIKPYIEHYTEPGDLVLDPFCGSGMTGVACLQTGRNAIISDLSPAAVHIAYNYCTPVDIAGLRAAWAKIKADVAEESAWLYGTTCDRCSGPATIQYTVWSDVFGCPTCEADIVLWDAALVRHEAGGTVDPPLSGLTKASPDWQGPAPSTAPRKRRRAGDITERQPGDMLEPFPCPNCSQPQVKAACSYRRTTPVLTAYECAGLCRPHRQERATTEAERDRIDEIAGLEPPYWVPETPFEETREMWRGVHRDQGITRVRDFWTSRNLWALASLWFRASTFPDERVIRALRFLITSTMLRASKLYKYSPSRMSGIMSGTLYIPSLNVERNVQVTADFKWKTICQAFQEFEARDLGTKTNVRRESANELAIADECIDYVFTDPPFGSNIFYADCSLLWESWLGDLTDEEHEAVWNRSKKPQEGGKTLEDYQELMEQSFAEMYRVLKPGRWATVVFSNSDDCVWHAIQTAAAKAGFAVAESGSLDKVQRSFKGTKGAKGEERVVTKDVVMNLLKPATVAAIRRSVAIADPEEHVRELLHTYLAELVSKDGAHAEKRTTQALYDHVVTSLLAEGQQTVGFGLAVVQSVAQASFKQVDGLWYRRGDRVQTDKPRMNIADESSAVLWLDHRLTIQPLTEAEIIPEFNQASAGARVTGGLARLLRENFVEDPRTKRWRVPTALERDALNDIGQEQRRRRLGRAAKSDSEGATASELLEMVEEAVRLEMYDDAEELLGRVHVPDLGGADRDRVGLLRSVISAHQGD